MSRQPLPEEVRKWIGWQLFEHVPSNIVVINRDFEVVAANSNFTSVFGKAHGKHCYEVYKKRNEVCEQCMAARTFEDGEARVTNEDGIDRQGNPAYYVVHNVPVRNGSNEITHVIEMSYDVTDTKSLQRQYNVLFERVPCYVAVLNRDLRIVRANEMLRNTFGETKGQLCYQVYKHRLQECEDCPALKTFSGGGSYTTRQVGINKKGEITHYISVTAPLARTGSEIHHVVEMSIDVTESHKLSQELLKESSFRHELTENAMDALVGIDPSGFISIFNPAAEKLFKMSAIDVIGKKSAWDILPEEFHLLFHQAGSTLDLPDTVVRDAGGEEIPVRFSGTVLGDGEAVIGAAAFLQDLRAFKKLEREKMASERLAVVGQTVTQLSHGMKNILTGVQGGLYGIKAGIKRNDSERLSVGWDRLERNVGRLNELVRGFLNFTKEHVPEVKTTDLNRLAEEVFALYRDAAEKEGVELRLDSETGVGTANVDPDDIHTCLVNLVSNAIDACREKETDRTDMSVTIRLKEENGVIIFEVADTGCGMNEATKNKVFTTFFTTKGLQGNGLGLLVTRKLVHAHHGRVDVESTPGEGSLFRIELPRDDLPVPPSNNDAG